MTTATEATLPATGTAPVTTLELPIESQTEADEAAELEATEPGDSEEKDDDSEADKVQAEVDKATRKARRRIDRLIAERAASNERAAELQRQLAEATKPRETGEDGKPKADTPDPRALAEQMVKARETAKTLAKVMKEATAKYGATFDSKVAELVEEIGPQLDANGQPTPLMEAVLDSDHATQLLAYLGDNTEIAAELVGLSPSRLGRRIAQIETDLAAAAKPKTSAAAKPLSPVKAAAVPTVDPTKLTDKQWRAQRLAERSKA